MIDHETLRKLRELKLDGMATGFEELLIDACLEDVRCEPGRGLDKALRDLATGRCIESKLNVILVGKTGVGNTPRPPRANRGTCARRFPARADEGQRTARPPRSRAEPVPKSTGIRMKAEAPCEERVADEPDGEIVAAVEVEAGEAVELAQKLVAQARRRGQ